MTDLEQARALSESIGAEAFDAASILATALAQARAEGRREGLEELLTDVRAALLTFRTARTEAQFSLAMIQADSLLARLEGKP